MNTANSAATKIGTGPCSAQVANIAELSAAISGADPGAVICLKPGVYDAARAPGEMIQIEGRHGQVNKPIVLRGQAGVVITNTGTLDAIYINRSSYIGLEDLVIQDVFRAVMIDESTRISMSNLLVERTAQEAIHFRKNTTHSVLVNSRIRDVGVDTKNNHPAMKRFAEAIYIGTARSNWAKVMGSATAPDASDNNCVSGNRVGPNIAAEGLDLKEGTRNTYILNNVFDLGGISGHNFADSALDLKGSAAFVGHNTFINPARRYIEKLMRVQSGKDVQISDPGKLNGLITPDAIQTHIVPNVADSGSKHLVWGNVAHLQSSHRPAGYTQGMLLRIDDEQNASRTPQALGTRLCKGNSVGKDDLLSNIAETDCPDIPLIKACPQVLMQPL